MANNSEVAKKKITMYTDSKLNAIGEVVVARMKLLLEGYIGRPSKLVDDIQYRVENGVVTVFTTLPLTRYFEEGTKPHDIRPKRGKALKFRAGNSFTGKSGQEGSFGDTVFAQVVHHPGTEAKPFFSQAIFLSKKDIEDILAGKKTSIEMGNTDSSMSQ